MAAASFDRSLTEEKLHDAEQRLRSSMQQIVVIDGQIRELEILYKRAQKSRKNASRYNLRLKLSVVSGESDLDRSGEFKQEILRQPAGLAASFVQCRQVIAESLYEFGYPDGRRSVKEGYQLRVRAVRAVA